MGGVRRIAAEREDVPAERRLAEVVRVLPADDVTVLVRRARVRSRRSGRWLEGPRVGARRCRGALLFVSVATAVSDSGKVSIHSGRSIFVAPTASAAPRVLIRMSFSDQPASTGLSGVSGSHSPVPSGVELRDVQDAVVQRVDAVPRRPAPGQFETIPINVFELLVVAHVDDDAAVARLLHPRALVLQAPERRALHRRRGGIERIDLDDPAEPVRLVRLFVDARNRLSVVCHR